MDKEMIVAWVMEHAKPEDVGWIGGNLVGKGVAQAFRDAADKMEGK